MMSLGIIFSKKFFYLLAEVIIIKSTGDEELNKPISQVGVDCRLISFTTKPIVDQAKCIVLVRTLNNGK